MELFTNLDNSKQPTADASLLEKSISTPCVITEPLNNRSPDDEESQERKLRRKVDRRLCSIAGILCSLTLLDSGILSSASVTSMLEELHLEGSRYSVSIVIFTIASIAFQLPCTLAVRLVGPRIWFAAITVSFGIITLGTAFIRTWQQMITVRVLLGISTSGIQPGLTYLISTWYTKKEQQLRFAFLQCGQVVFLATGTIINYGLNHLNGRAGLSGWRWMYLIQGLITSIIGIATYWWMVEFPDKARRSFQFLSDSEARLAVQRIEIDRNDAVPDSFTWDNILVNFTDVKLYGFCCMYFLLNLVSTSLNYFLPIILESGMGFSSNKSILFSTLPYYWATIPVLITSLVGDAYQRRGPLIAFNVICAIIGFLMLGALISNEVAVRYIGTFLATGAYVSNWAALNAFMANNITGHWKRATVGAAVAACNGLGGIAGSYIVRQREAPTYPTAVWVSIGSQFILVGIVGLLSIYFYFSNRKQRRQDAVLLNGVGFKYTY